MRIDSRLAASQTATVAVPIKPHKMPTRWQRVIADLKLGLRSWHIWWLLAWQDIRLRYRRSQLGPFWITLSMAINIFAMGFLYSHLFHIDLHDYFPYLTVGMLTWNLISVLINDNVNTFIEAEGYLKNIKLPYSAFVLRVVCRSFIVFAHNLVVLIPVLIFFPVKFNWFFFMEMPALIIIGLTAFGYGLILAIVGARYRDMGQIIASLIQVAFFVTPVMWNSAVLSPQAQFIIQFNPFVYFVTLLRSPFLGSMPNLATWIVTVSIMLLGLALALILFLRVRHRIIYWL